MNPHKQRLLAAEMRGATLPKDEKKKPQKKPKSSSSKRKEDKQALDPESSRSAYSKAKRDFMDKFLEPILDCQHASIDFAKHAQILSQVNSVFPRLAEENPGLNQKSRESQLMPQPKRL